MKKALLIFLISFNALAHPVIYQGGFAISSSNMADMNSNYVLYSITNRWALGLEQWRMGKNEKNNDYGFFKVNHLLWRHNGDDSQANLYLHGGAGVLDQEWRNRNTKATFMGGAEGDWETRILYTSLKYLEFESTAMAQGRVGLSPRLANFDQLQTWLMVQGRWARDMDETIQITPLIRFFYHNILWEMGSSTRGEWLLNFMVHY